MEPRVRVVARGRARVRVSLDIDQGARPTQLKVNANDTVSDNLIITVRVRVRLAGRENLCVCVQGAMMCSAVAEPQSKQSFLRHGGEQMVSDGVRWCQMVSDGIRWCPMVSGDGSVRRAGPAGRCWAWVVLLLGVVLGLGSG